MTDTHSTDRQSVGDTAVNADPATMTLQYGDYKVAVSELPAKAIAYLLQNGFSQSMTDAAALTKEQKHHKADDGTLTPMSDDELDAKVKSLRDARFEKIKAGEVGVRVGGPRGSSMDNLLRTVATEFMRAKLAKFKLTLPTGKDAAGNAKTIDIKGLGPMTREQLIAREIEKNGDAVRAEAERRRALAGEAVEEGEDIADAI